MAARSNGRIDEVDPYSDVRLALRPEHAVLPADELRVIVGIRPTLIALHDLLASPQPQRAALAALLGDAGRRSVRLNGSDVPLPTYLRLLSRMCGEAADQAEEDSGTRTNRRSVCQSEEAPPAPSPPDPFPTAAYSLTLDRGDAALNAQMAAIASDKSLSALCAAVVDLAPTPTGFAYAGFNDRDMIFVGSMQKISAAYAAFELRSRVRTTTAAAIDAGLSSASAGWERSVIADLRTAWRPRLRAGFPTLPAGFPDLGGIFTFSPSGKVDFAVASPALTDGDIDRIGEFGTPRGKFGDWLRLMLRWSNNDAAGSCIRALSYPLINGTLAGAGFFVDRLHNGMWLSADYTDHDWIPNPPNDPQANRAGQTLSPRWQKAQGRKLSNATATASQVADFMTLLATDKLLSGSRDNQDMRALMTGATGIGSYVASALHRHGRQTTSVVSKIGYGDDSRSHDCAIVERAGASGVVRYVVVGLGSRPETRDDLDSLFLKLDDIIMARHP